MTLCLADGVHWCIANDRVVLLDLKADTYSCLPPAADQAWRKRWAGETLSVSDAAALKDLMDTGVLVDGKTLLNPPSTQTVSRSLLDEVDADTAPVSPEAAWDQVLTACQLRTRSLFALIAGVRRRKQLAEPLAQWMNEAKQRDIARFMASRRLLSRQSQCLRTSMALVSFLARRRCYPDLVIGVRMRPFAAHAWVQTADMVLNDMVDAVAPYTPILVV